VAGSTAPTPFTGYNSTSLIASGSTLGQFAMISEANLLGTGKSANFWDAINTAGGGATITVPIGIADVTDVQTMLSNIWGSAGLSDTTVTFDFGTLSNGGITDSLAVTLINSGAAGSAASGQIRSGVDCASGCSGFPSGPLAATSTASATLNSNPTTAVTVNTSNLFTMDYNSVGGVYAGSAGTVNLDAQDFFIPVSLQGQYLVDMRISEASGVYQGSQTALSAITVNTASLNTASTPEPSTVVSLLTGLGVLALGRFRRK
jgi:hypothetical protein